MRLESPYFLAQSRFSEQVRRKLRRNCAGTVHERVVLRLLGLAFERKQIPRPDLLETLAIKKYQRGCWKRLSRFASRGSGVRVPPRPPNLIQKVRLRKFSFGAHPSV